MVRFARMYRHYLLGQKFIVRMDHHSLIWLLSFICPQDQLARWLEELSQYHMVIQHRLESRHCNAAQSVLSAQQPPRIRRSLPLAVRIASQTPRTRTPRAPRLLVLLPHASGGGGSVVD